MAPVRRSLVLLVAGLCLPGCSNSSATAPVLFGHIAPLSGPERDAGTSAVRGIRLAVMEADKDPDKGAGRVVKVIHTDTLGRLDAFEAEAVRLVKVNRVTALLGGNTPEEVERLERAGVAVVSPCGEPPRSRNDAVVCTGLSPARQGELLGRFTAEQFRKYPVLVLADETRDGSLTLAEAFARALEAATAKENKKTAFRPSVLRYGKEIELADLVERVRKQQPAAVLLAGALADLRELRMKLGEKGPTLFFGGADVSVRPLRDLGGKGAVYVVTAFVADADAPKAAAFVKKYRETFSEEPDVHAALAYDNTRLLCAAVRRTKDNLTSAAVRDELAQLKEWVKDFQGLTGPLVLREGRLLRPAFVVRVEDGQVKTAKRYGAEE
jgi:branched-chain amino acid transport system substrate-binding protein